MRKGHWIYFLGTDGFGLVKIGLTCNVEKRIGNLVSSSPVKLSLLATAPGNRNSENAIHTAFRHLRSHSEWFHADSNLTALIDQVRADGVLPPQFLPAHLVKCPFWPPRRKHSRNPLKEAA